MEVVVEADKAIFSLLLWTGTNVQAVGDPTLVERDWTDLFTDQARMHLIQVRIAIPFGHLFLLQIEWYPIHLPHLRLHPQVQLTSRETGKQLA